MENSLNTAVHSPAPNWKQLFDGLQTITKENQTVMHTVREEMDRQKEKVRSEIMEAAQKLKVQQTDLEDMLESMDSDALLAASSDGQAMESCRKSLLDQMEKTRLLLAQVQSLLDTPAEVPVLSTPVSNKSRSDREKNATYLPKLFRKEHILGNWVHYFDDNTFTCQSFWEDGSFKEYDFEDNKLASERDGIYTIDNGSLNLLYGSGKKDQYQITGFSDERIDYRILGNNVQFDYMPESLLNQFLDAE